MKEMTCSFCGRSSREVSMIPGADGKTVTTPVYCLGAN